MSRFIVHPGWISGAICLVDLVQHMLDLHRRLSAARDPRTREQLQRQITTTDHRIDRLVYALYGLTEEGVGIVERKFINEH